MDVDQIRLSKLMAQRGLCSRREADDYISQGWVEVDGQIIDQLGSKIHASQTITLLNKAKQSQQSKLTVILNKPVGYVSGTPEKGYKPAASLIQDKNFWGQARLKLNNTNHALSSLAPAGRLDIDSQGLLVLTQDGRIARQLIKPDSMIEKEYLVRFCGEITAAKINLLQHGLSLDGRKLQSAKINLINDEQLRFILTEGRKRQIRRMCDLVEIKIQKLQRVRIGNVRLNKLPLGQWRFLGHNEHF